MKTNECKCNMKIKHCNVRHFSFLSFSFHLLCARLSFFSYHFPFSISFFAYLSHSHCCYFPLTQCLQLEFSTHLIPAEVLKVSAKYYFICFYCTIQCANGKNILLKTIRHFLKTQNTKQKTVQKIQLRHCKNCH